MRSFPKTCDPILKSRTTRALKRLRDLREDLSVIKDEIEQLLEANDQTLTTATGCGPIIAAQIIGEIGDISKFKSPGALAKYAGCAPRQHSSGKTTRWRKTRSGNRRLNRVFHQMALVQISRHGSDRAKEYFIKKISEGKSKSLGARLSQTTDREHRLEHDETQNGIPNRSNRMKKILDFST